MNLDVASLGTILGVWAHPDDEAYLMAGVMAAAADAGQHVACVTATMGDAGETADEARWPRDRLSEIRQDELRRSLAVLGVDDHHSLDLPDGRLADLEPDGHIDRIAAVMERVEPDTVVTFGPDGMTGHPDHTTVSSWAAAARARTGNGGRLLWATKTPEWADAHQAINGEVFPPGLPPVVPADRAWCLELDDEFLERKVQALEAHASQTLGLIRSMGRDAYAEWVRLEAFSEAKGSGRGQGG